MCSHPCGCAHYCFIIENISLHSITHCQRTQHRLNKLHGSDQHIPCWLPHRVILDRQYWNITKTHLHLDKLKVALYRRSRFLFVQGRKYEKKKGCAEEERERKNIKRLEYFRAVRAEWHKLCDAMESVGFFSIQRASFISWTNYTCKAFTSRSNMYFDAHNIAAYAHWNALSMQQSTDSTAVCRFANAIQTAECLFRSVCLLESQFTWGIPNGVLHAVFSDLIFFRILLEACRDIYLPKGKYNFMRGFEIYWFEKLEPETKGIKTKKIYGLRTEIVKCRVECQSAINAR